MKRIKFGLITIVALLMWSWSFAQNCDEKKLEKVAVAMEEMALKEESNVEVPKTSSKTDSSSSAALKNQNSTAQKMIPKVKVDVINMPIDIAGIIISIFTILIALISFYIAYRTFKMQRQNNIDIFNLQKQHYLKSVKPIGRIAVGDYENDIYVKIVNNGVGPLIISEFRVSSSNDLDIQDIHIDLFEIIPEEIKAKISTWTDFIRGTVKRAIKPGDELYLLRLTALDIENNREGINELKSFLQHLTLDWAYKDIYEEQTHRGESTKLAWLGRNLASEDDTIKTRKDNIKNTKKM